jgi:hypothetical protein
MRSTFPPRLAAAPAVTAAALALCGAVLLPSCYPGDELTVSEADVVVTAFSKDIDFATVLDYALADSVIHLVPEGEDDDISRSFDATVLAAVRDNMDALGFNEVVDPDLADVVMAVAVSTSEYTDYYSYSPCYYYCWYYPYPPGWGWYYPSYIGAYSYTVGTIFINMIENVDPAGDEGRIPVAWVAALNGLADKGSNATRIQNGVDQAFAQSQYLGAGK